jgi:hypothetical protein
MHHEENLIVEITSLTEQPVIPRDRFNPRLADLNRAHSTGVSHGRGLLSIFPTVGIGGRLSNSSC